MPCPYFEPQRTAPQSTHATARLPLIDEYEGLCHAGEQTAEVPANARFRFCNHGHSRGECGKASANSAGCFRFELLKRDNATLELLVIEEQDYAPVRWFRVDFRSADDRLDPEPADVCLRAQARAFCESYLRRFPDLPTDA